MADVFLLNIAGADRPGLTNAITGILAEHEVRVLDIGQAVIHDHLTLGILIELPHRNDLADLLLKFHMSERDLDIKIRVTPVETDEYEAWVGKQGQERTILTILGRDIQASVFKKLTGLLLEQGLNIEKISRLSGRISLVSPTPSPRSCIELSILGTPKDRSALKQQILSISQVEQVDLALQSDDMFRRNRRLVVFDMDSTLIRCEVIDELARLAGVYEEVAQITERAMRGELDFKASFTKRLALLEGLELTKVEEFTKQLPLMDGAERLISTLKRLGFKTAICSGGFTPMGRRLQEILGIDYVFANELESRDGKLTGRPSGDIVDGQKKASLMARLADDLSLDLRQVIAIGDGANDLPMIEKAGLGIAFRAKPIVKASAKQALSILGLDAVLYLIGIRDRDLKTENTG